MIGVDKIGEIRRAYFEQQRSDQGDRADAFGVARDGAQGHPWPRDRVQVRAGRSADAEAGRLGRGSDGDPGAGSQAAEAGAPLDAAAVRGAAWARI